MRRVVTLSCLWIAWASAGTARAFGPTPMCALPLPEEPSPPVCGPAQLVPAPPVLCLAGLPEPQALGGGAVSSGAADIEAARVAMRQAEALADAGKLGDSMLQLRVVERLMPRVADRIALRRGELLRRLSMPEQACDAFALAAASPDRGITARAQIDGVRCLLQAGNRKGERAFERLLRRYPHLTERQGLSYELALAREGWGRVSSAVALLRRIDLDDPASAVARSAREELARLQSQGVKVAPYSAPERVARAEHMLYDGPFDQATAEVDALLQDHHLSAELRAKVLQLSARIARLQGRWDAARDDARRAEAGGAPAATEATPAQADEQEREAAERRIRALRSGRSIAHLRNAQLLRVFDVAVEHGLQSECDEALDAMRTRRHLGSALRFNAAIHATGVASDDKIARLLETLLDVPRYRVSARYHYARALERMGRQGEAEAQYLQVIGAERGRSPYYSMWADLRLWTIQSQSRESCLPPATAASLRASAGAARSSGALTKQLVATPADASASAAKWISPADAGDAPDAALSPAMSLLGAIFDGAAPTPQRRVRPLPIARGPLPATTSLAPPERLDDAGRAAPAPGPAQLRQRVLALLEPLAEQYGEAYPWLLRAEDLVQLELFDEAADEINEAYLAYRDASGALRLRSGLVALWTGSAPPRRPMTYAVRRARRALDRPARRSLGNIAAMLGDPGVGVRFGGDRLDARPRAYADLVESAAHKYGLDPNLLFAVMRVESIYNRRIVSNAGAVGLMQIMPATGERIARQLGVSDFDPVDLLDPRRNLEFSAWYLASLLQRFDGRLPLAIASYNGGPHNVRLWLRASPSHMPLDAFLERIPFSQTHEYVRRVLVYYSQYRAQQNLPMTRLSVELPEQRPDPLAF